MSTTCSHCGETLMGAVNRCWRCGTTFAEPMIADAPPIRRLAILPEYLDPQYEEAWQRKDTATQVSEDGIYDAEIYDAQLGDPSSPSADSPETPPPQRWRPTREQSIEGALLLVAIGALMFTFFTPWGIPLTIVALVLTAGRIHLRQSRLGWTAFLFALFALILSIARATLLLYQWTYPNMTPPWLPVW